MYTEDEQELGVGDEVYDATTYILKDNENWEKIDYRPMGLASERRIIHSVLHCIFDQSILISIFVGGGVFASRYVITSSNFR